MRLLIEPCGKVTAIYGEAIDLSKIGALAIVRASSVEPAHGGLWYADLSPVGGPILGPFTLRSAAIFAEIAWLETYLGELPLCKHPQSPPPQADPPGPAPWPPPPMVV